MNGGVTFRSVDREVGSLKEFEWLEQLYGSVFLLSVSSCSVRLQLALSFIDSHQSIVA